MYRMTLAALAAAAGILIAAAPSFAYTTYEIQGSNGANFASPDDQQQSQNGFSFSTRTSTGSANPYDPFATSNFGAPQQQQENLSRDMNWQGTGYYLRPNN